MKYSPYLLALAIFPSGLLGAEALKTQQPVEPVLRYVFPLGDRRGATVEVELRGDSLEGAYAFWSETGGIKGHIEKLEKLPEEPNRAPTTPGDAGEKPPAQRIVVKLQIEPLVSLGVHNLRVVTPRGLSTPVQFRVDSDPVIEETHNSHASPDEAQSVTLPGIINGKISKAGEVDYYAFEAAKDREILFESLLAKGITPELHLYRLGGSWLNPRRPIPILFREQRSSLPIPKSVRFTYRTEESGLYVLAVGSLFGIGGPNFAYEMRVAAAADPEPPIELTVAQWQERAFSRKLEPGWVAEIRSRTVELPQPKGAKDGASPPAGPAAGQSSSQTLPHDAPALTQTPTEFRESEPNDTPAQAGAISSPGLVVGAIQRPGDVDLFRFRVRAGENLAFEIETPREKPPYFIPELILLDSMGREVISNVEEHSSPIATDGHPISYLKRVVAKLIYNFSGDGEYILKIRDATSRYGNEGYAYRVLIRPQAPHIGEVVFKDKDKDVDQINLAQGEAHKITVIASEEEGFSGDVAYTVSGLPPGVQVLPAAITQAEKNPDAVQHERNLVPVQREAVILLMAEPNAPLTEMPTLAHLEFRPLVDGHPGQVHVVRDIPFMVVERKQSK